VQNPEHQSTTTSRIRILPDRVANQIAAGEVVERPAAVVKELVENSLDAGATRIDLNFENGGKRLIRVEDDGCGMCPDDALLALERHATSKLREAMDLDSIRSFGFRGEALPSIASVSRFTLRTRAEGWQEGSEILVNAGRIAEPRAVGMARGTRIEVAHLFEGVPARRKFLKSDRTEAAHIVLLCRLLAVAHPEVSFSLTENGRTVFRSPACPSLAERVGEVFGRPLATELMSIEVEKPGLRISGLISRPGAGRTTRAEMFWFANKRPVENRTLSSALLESCKGFIHRGRFPAAFLFLDIDPQALDVNVHPTKREIRLRDENGVRNFVMDAVFSRMEELTQADSGRHSAPLAQNTAPSATSLRPAIKPRQAPASIIEHVRQTHPETPRKAPPESPAPQAPTPLKSAPAKPSPRPAAPVPTTVFHKPQAPERSHHTTQGDALPSRWRYLGTAHGNHVLFETPDGLLCLNRAATLSRVLYEDYLHSLRGGHIMTQQLLFPRLFELPPLLADTLERHLDFFRTNGFAVESFGGDSFRIASVPAWFDGEGCEDFIKEAVERISENGMRPDRDAELARETLARLASAHASQSSAPTDELEVLSLARRLLACKNPLTDPQGRPTYFELSKSELGKR